MLKNVKQWKCRHCKKKINREKDAFVLITWGAGNYGVVEERCFNQFKYNHANFTTLGSYNTGE